MGTQIQGISFLHHHRALRQIQFKELLNHRKGFGIAHHLHFRIFLCKHLHTGRMIRLHVGNHQIVHGSSCQSFFQIFQPFVRSSCVYGIHNGRFIIQNYIGIIRYSIWNHILALKQIQISVVCANIYNIICDCYILHTYYFPPDFCMDSPLRETGTASSWQSPFRLFYFTYRKGIRQYLLRQLFLRPWQELP